MHPFFFSIIIGIILILVAAQLLIVSAKHIAHVLKIPSLLVSLLLVSIGTSLPELIVAVTSIVKNDPGLGLGNIIGSNIINSTLLFGIAIVSGRLRVGTQKTQRNIIVLSIVTVIFVLLQQVSVAPIIQTLFLLGLAFAIGSYHFELSQVKTDKPVIHHHPYTPMRIINLGGTFVISVLLMSFGGTLYVNGLEQFAQFHNLSTTVVGLLLSSLATTTPELMTTLVAMFKKESKIALGNLLGSNIYNLSLIGGILSLEKHASVLRMTDLVFLVISACLFIFIIRHFKGRCIPHWIGIALIVSFVAFFGINILWL